MEDYEERYNELSTLVAKLRDAIWEIDEAFCEEHIGEMVGRPEWCVEAITRWMKLTTPRREGGDMSDQESYEDYIARKDQHEYDLLERDYNLAQQRIAELEEQVSTYIGTGQMLLDMKIKLAEAEEILSRSMDAEHEYSAYLQKHRDGESGRGE